MTGADVAGAAVVVLAGAGAAVEGAPGVVLPVVGPVPGSVARVPLVGTAAAGRPGEGLAPQADTARGANNGSTVHR